MKLTVLSLAISALAASTVLQPMTPIEPTVTLSDNGRISPITVEEYVARVVAHEMPYTFCEEALKAQAVAARTYLYYCLDNNSHPHESADVCTDITHCCGYITEDELDGRYGDGYGKAAFERVRAAVRATDGEVMTFGGEPLLALWHAFSDGFTEDCGAVFGGKLPYLRAVPTPERIASHTVSFTVGEAVRRLQSVGYDCTSAAQVSTSLTDSGRCKELTLGGIRISGGEARSIFGLRSTDFLAFKRGDRLYFCVRGYGHGVGMSQQGANLMAENGASYREILAHYYVGCDFKSTK